MRGLAKKIRSNCFVCKRFQITAFANPPPGALSLDRTVGNKAFQVIGVDYTCPLYYRIYPTKEGKAYILLISCSLTRVIHLQPLKEQTTDEFIGSLKLLIARCGRPQTIYSDNAKTVTAAASWIKKVVKNETVHNFLAHQEIKCKFNVKLLDGVENLKG